MSEQSANEAATVSFGERLANSQAFSDLFRDGMTLVEETASYLDGPGRQESKKLDRTAALAYATESMRLTTRLMQLASWLLLHRAVKEGEMSLAQANKEKAKVKLSAADNDDSNYKVLPERLRHLIDRSRHLQERSAGSTPPCMRGRIRAHPCRRQSGRAPDRPAQGRVRAGVGRPAIATGANQNESPARAGLWHFGAAGVTSP